MKPLLWLISIAAALMMSTHAEARRTPVDTPVRAIAVSPGTSDARMPDGRPLAPCTTTAAAETTVLYQANFNAHPCSPAGWTAVDMTSPAPNQFHVDDYAGLPFGPLQGTKSLWCGARSWVDFPLCSYATFPGYGDSWRQTWCTKSCLPTAGGPTNDLDVSMTIRFDTEPSYDFTALEYTSDCTGNSGWTEIDGGNPLWTGQDSLAVDSSYAVGPGPVKVRLLFVSDGSWSDEDGHLDTDGALHVDNLQIEGLGPEDFEGQAVGATESDDWRECGTDGYGIFAGLQSGSALLQEDPCRANFSCMWAFITGSTATYGCGGHPEQIAVPFENARNQFLSNEVWSPLIPLSGQSGQLLLEFDVYRDLPFDNLIFYGWKVRTIVEGCPTAWENNAGPLFGDQKDWFHHVAHVGSVVNLTNASHVQVALAVQDLCELWCGIGGSGQCHSHAPLFDNVKVSRVNMVGPQWNVRAVDTFQDTFATDGTITGTARADAALNVAPSTSPTITPGDSSVVLAVGDPLYAGTGNTSGLSDDPNLSTFVGRHKTKKQVYMWVAVWPQGQPGKSGDGLSEGPGGQANRYPHIPEKDYTDVNGVTWSAIRFDYTYAGTPTTPGLGTGTQPRVDNRFNVDLKDNLFEPGDTICYFYGATSPGGTTYYSYNWHATDNIAEVAANPMEFTILPAGGFNRGGDLLYVDGADGFGSQPYFDGALQVLRLLHLVDRYDVRAPDAGVGNRLDGRVVNVANQLNACYHGILWDCGSLPITLGDGTGNPEKSDDYALLNTFLGNIGSPGFEYSQGGVYLCGDDVAQSLFASGSTSASMFRSTYMEFTLASSNHINAGLGVSPNVIHWPGRAFSDDAFVFGGCPQLNDFDVLAPTGTSLIQMSYGAPQSADGAILSHSVVQGMTSANVQLSGFSFAAIRDDELNGISDRAEHLHDIIESLVSGIGAPTATRPTLRDDLSQNYPNPFNPQTTIAFSLKHRGHVSIAVYDVAGRRVRTLANENRPAGAHTVTWDGRDDHGQPVSSGVYFYKLVAGEFSQTKKMVLLK